MVFDPSCQDLTELTADPTKLPNGGTHYNSIGRFPSAQLFNPVVERHLLHLVGKYFVALRDISAGEELVVNYLSSTILQKDWEDVVTRLRYKCEEEFYTRANSCSYPKWMRSIIPLPMMPRVRQMFLFEFTKMLLDMIWLKRQFLFAKDMWMHLCYNKTYYLLLIHASARLSLPISHKHLIGYHE